MVRKRNASRTLEFSDVKTGRRRIFTLYPGSRFSVRGLDKERAEDLSFPVRESLHESITLQSAYLCTESFMFYWTWGFAQYCRKYKLNDLTVSFRVSGSFVSWWARGDTSCTPRATDMWNVTTAVDVQMVLKAPVYIKTICLTSRDYKSLSHSVVFLNSVVTQKS